MSENFVDGPGCTPASVAGRAAALRILAQAQREQWQPREEDPANIPVRRQVDGRWQTVMVTLSDWRANEGSFPTEGELYRRIFNEDQEDEEDEEPGRRCSSAHARDEECPQCP